MRGRGVDQKGRSKVEEQYVRIPYSKVTSNAWRALRPSSIKVYIELHRRFNGSNNGKLTLSLDEASRILKLGKATVQRSLQDLQEKGFVKMTKRGHWYGRKASEWALTDQWLNGHNPTYDWKKWLPVKKKKQIIDPVLDPNDLPTNPN